MLEEPENMHKDYCNKYGTLPDVTVLVATYNSDSVRTYSTIESVLAQEGCSIQLVVADDGSDNNHFSTIGRILAKREFDNFKLISSTENRGTVDNILNAMQYVRAPIVRTIGPGDYLYGRTSLSKMVHAMQYSGSAVCFGSSIHYSEKNGFHILPGRIPVLLKPYTKNPVDNSLAKRYQIRYADYILGAASAYNSAIFERCLRRLSGYVRLCEDYAARMMLADGEKISVVNDYVVWYEADVGTSNSTSTIGHSWTEKDQVAQGELFKRLYPDDSDVAMMAKYEKCRENGASNLRKLLCDPVRAFFRIKRLLAKKTLMPANVNVAEYQAIVKQGRADFEELEVSV